MEADINLQKKLHHLIEGHFTDPEVFEVAIYALTRLSLFQMADVAIAAQQGMMENVPPQAVKLVLDYESGLTTNQFYIDNFAPIRTQITVDEIKSNSKVEYLKGGIQTGNDRSILIARHMISNRYDSLTTIMLLWKGVRPAKKFDMLLREIAGPSKLELDMMKLVT